MNGWTDVTEVTARLSAWNRRCDRAMIITIVMAALVFFVPSRLIYIPWAISFLGWLYCRWRYGRVKNELVRKMTRAGV